MTTWLMLLGLLAKAPTLSVQAAALGTRASVSVQSQETLGAVDVGRDGDEIVVRVDGESDGVQPQAPVSPLLQSLTLGSDGSRLVVRIGVAIGTVHEIRRDARSLTILLEPPAAEQPSSTAQTIPAADLYRRIFPVSPATAADATDVQMSGESAAGTGAGASSRGLLLGRVTLSPSLTAGYVDEEYIPPGAAAQQEQFFQVQPRIDASAPISTGSARLGYEPRLRAGSSAPALRKVSHLADGALDLPLGSNLEVNLSDHFSRGVLETEEVDPGREYFSNLATFTSQQFQSSLHYDLGANVKVDLSARAGGVRFAQPSGFFNYDSRGASGDLSRELTPNLRLAVGAAYDQVDAPARPAASMHAASAQAQLNGDLAPLTRGNIMLGWTRQENPQAPAEARSFNGFTANATIRRDLGYSSTIALTAVRATHPSGFGNDGFFVTTAGQLEVAFLLPFAVSFQGGTGYHVNQYRAVAPEIGRPRRDQITYWSVGLGRAVGRWGFWRVDYRREQRNSNIDTFDNIANTFVVRVGVGYFGEAKRQ